MSEMHFNTAAAQLAGHALDRCAREAILTVIVAAPGRGKSWAIRRWSAANAGKTPHIRVTCTVRNSPYAMLHAICAGLQITLSGPRRGSDTACAVIAARLAARRTMIIVDEADMLTLGALEKLRGIWDEVSELRQMDGEHAFPLALCGTGRLRDLLMREDLERLHRRVGEFEELPGLDADETALIVEKKWTSARVDNDALSRVHGMSRGSFGWINRIMGIAAELAAKDGGVVNTRILKATERYLNLIGLPGA